MKLAGVQMDVALADPSQNRERMAERFIAARRQGADLVIFPECALTGYCLESREEAAPFAESTPGPTTAFFAELCAKQGGSAIYGMIETAGSAMFNAAVHVGAEGVIASYRKVHLPYLGVDRFLDFGDRPFAVHDVSSSPAARTSGDATSLLGRRSTSDVDESPSSRAALRIGLNICYDSGFPESSRVLALAGADLVVLPTNWPNGAETLAEHAIATRALENAIYYAAVNRVGEERGFRFIGRSRICDPTGKTLAVGSETKEEILYADIDVEKARKKTIVRVPGKHLIDRVADRRPEFYGPLVEPHGLPRPGRDVPADRFS
jgi:predicted amidohydrolase